MATEHWVPLAYPMTRHIAQVWSVPQGLSSLSPPGHSSHFQGERETSNPNSQSSLFLLLHPINTTSPTLISPVSFFFPSCWTRRPMCSFLNLFHKFSQFLLVLEPLGDMVQVRYIHGWNILNECKCERGQVLGTFREVIQGSWVDHSFSVAENCRHFFILEGGCS